MRLYCKPPEPGLSVKEYTKQRYHNRKEAGICVRCGKQPAIPGKIVCLLCQAEYADYSRLRYEKMTDEEKAEHNRKHTEKYYANKAAGICVRCGKRKAAPGRVSCEWCLAKTNESSKKSHEKKGRYKRYKEQGLCLSCGAERAPGYQFCPECLEKKRAYAAKARETAGVAENRKRLAEKEHRIIMSKVVRGEANESC